MNPKVIFGGSKSSVLDDSRISVPKVHILMHMKTCLISIRKWAQKLSKSRDLRHARVPMLSCQGFWILRETVHFRSGKSAIMNSFESRMPQILGFMMNPNGVHWGSYEPQSHFRGSQKFRFGWFQTFQELHMKCKNQKNKSSPDDVDSSSYFVRIVCNI